MLVFHPVREADLRGVNGLLSFCQQLGNGVLRLASYMFGESLESGDSCHAEQTSFRGRGDVWEWAV